MMQRIYHLFMLCCLCNVSQALHIENQSAISARIISITRTLHNGIQNIPNITYQAQEIAPHSSISLQEPLQEIILAYNGQQYRCIPDQHEQQAQLIITINRTLIGSSTLQIIPLEHKKSPENETFPGPVYHML